MNFQDASIVLEVIRTRNISKAAKNLYMAQSTVSSRIQQIETELGCELFQRKKGLRNLELTVAGEELLPICQNIRSAQERLESLKQEQYQELRIASNESFYYEVLQDFCVSFKRNHPEIHLSLNIKDTEDVHQLISRGISNIGFASYDDRYKGVDCTPIYTQHWCIISGKELETCDDVVNLDAIDPREEVFYSAGDLMSLYIWRQQHLHTKFVGSMRVNSYIESLKFIREFQGWEFATKNWAKKMQKFGEYHIYELPEPPETRKIYQIIEHGKLFRDVETAFLEELSEFLILLSEN